MSLFFFLFFFCLQTINQQVAVCVVKHIFSRVHSGTQMHALEDVHEKTTTKKQHPAQEISQRWLLQPGMSPNEVVIQLFRAITHNIDSIFVLCEIFVALIPILIRRDTDVKIHLVAVS